MKRLYRFLERTYPAESFDWILKAFLNNRLLAGLSSASLWHLYRSLAPLESLQKPIEAITAHDLHAYIEDLKLQYSPGTLRATVGDIKQFFAWCHSYFGLDENPAATLKKPAARPRLKAAPEPALMVVMDRLVSELRPLVYRDLFGALHAENYEDWRYEDFKALHDLFVIAALYETGARAGELISLKARDMVASTRAPRIAYSVTAWGKTGSQTLRFTERTAELWRLWYRLRPYDFSFAVWSWRRGFRPQQATTSGLGQMLVRRCRSANVEPFRAHALRHSKVRRSRRLVGLELASELVGHSSLAVTQAYANIDNDELDQATKMTGIQRDLW